MSASKGDIDNILNKMDELVGQLAQPIGPIKKQQYEHDLLALYGSARDVLEEALKKDDRKNLVDTFGGNCLRVARLAHILDTQTFSTKGTQNDRRTEMCRRMCDNVVGVLEDVGLKDRLVQAKEEIRCSLHPSDPAPSSKRWCVFFVSMVAVAIVAIAVPLFLRVELVSTRAPDPREEKTVPISLTATPPVDEDVTLLAAGGITALLLFCFILGCCWCKSSKPVVEDDYDGEESEEGSYSDEEDDEDARNSRGSGRRDGSRYVEKFSEGYKSKSWGFV